MDFGESELALRVRSVALGATTREEWWGPGIRNALVLSDNAPGIPRAFVRTARPYRTRIGEFTAAWESGTLTESVFFDTISTNNYRSFSALTISYHPANARNVALGLARAVYAPESGRVPSLNAMTRVFRWRPSAGLGDTASADQITSVFGRWIFPASGFELYTELARMQMPRSLAELVQTPYFTGGYTFGFQWALAPDSSEHLWRLQGEVTSLEQNSVHAGRPPADFYTGRAAAQGYTQRGQIIGAAIGPGSSSQWLAADRINPRWHVGAFVGRTRWEDNAMYRQPFTTFFSHDVTIYSGLRGGYRLPLTDVSFDLTFGRRFNYLFQNGFSNPGQRGTVRVQNITFATRLTPR